jgi:hypothetical protein
VAARDAQVEPEHDGMKWNPWVTRFAGWFKTITPRTRRMSAVP